ncbi:glycosyltransferase family 87 protein [Pseudarthrobacter sp. NPDC092439]|uniref:glycosyltransferase family 87 protein n=1 Tax=unclassified Pseudarthrobacter TaxID=2647000 RepID=UPI0038304363
MQETQPQEHLPRARLMVPSRSDHLLRNFTEVVGGPLGARAEPGVVSPGFFSVDRVLVLLTILAAFAGLLVKGYCRVNGWDTPSQFYSTCYSDLPDIFRNRGLADGAFPIAAGQFEYPALTGLIAGITAWLVPGSGATDARILAYFDLNAVLLAAAAMVAVLATARLAGRRAWDASFVALAPGIILAGTINWDLWTVALLAVGMYFFATGRLVASGLLVGLAAATNLYPLMFLVAVALLSVRTGRFRPLAVSSAAAGAGWLAVNVPFMAANAAGWGYYFTSLADRPAGYGSPWFAYNLLAERLNRPALSAEAVNVLSSGLFLLACAAIALVALSAPRRPRLAQLLFLLVAAFILTGKAYSPQYVVWLIPLFALVRPHWREFLVWQGIEGLHWGAVWMYLGQVTSAGSTQHNLDMLYYVLAVVAHMLAVAYLVVRVAGDIYEPARDQLRRQHADDPHGGPFDQVPDAFRLGGPHSRAGAGANA